MKVVLDIECNALKDPSEIWVIVAKDIESDKLYIFRSLTTDRKERIRFSNWFRDVDLLIGHNLLSYDLPVMERLLDIQIPIEKCLDTLVISKLVDYSRPGHSVEHYGEAFGLLKGFQI